MSCLVRVKDHVDDELTGLVSPLADRVRAHAPARASSSRNHAWYHEVPACACSLKNPTRSKAGAVVPPGE